MMFESQGASLSSRSWELFVTTLAQSVALGAVIMTSVFIGTIAGHGVGVKCARAESSRNLVMIPVYQEGNIGSKPDGDTDPVAPAKKVAYAPEDDELPVVHTKEAQAEVKGGVEFPAGPEVVIDPDGGVAILNQPIVEKIENDPPESGKAGTDSKPKGCDPAPAPASVK